MKLAQGRYSSTGQRLYFDGDDSPPVEEEFTPDKHLVALRKFLTDTVPVDADVSSTALVNLGFRDHLQKLARRVSA